MVLVKDPEIVEEFRSCLDWLKDSDPWEIGELTTITTNLFNDYAGELVVGLEQHIGNVSPKLKLPGLYLLDSMVKNANPVYANLFAEQLVNTFSSVFTAVDSKTRGRMFDLRKTWSKTFSTAVLYDLDCKIKSIDGNWPIINATPPSSDATGSSRSSVSSPADNTQKSSPVDNSPRNSPVNESHVRSPMEIPSVTQFIDTSPIPVREHLTAGHRQVQGNVFNPPITSFAMFATEHAGFSGEQSVGTNVKLVQSVSLDEKTSRAFSNSEFLSDLSFLVLPGDDSCSRAVNQRKRSNFFTEEDSKKSRTDSWQ